MPASTAPQATSVRVSLARGRRHSHRITAAEAMRIHATPSTWMRANSSTANDGPR